MKKSILILLIVQLFISIPSFSIDDIKVTSKINHVTVYQQGAQVTRKASFKTQKGLTKLIIEGMSTYYDQESIQVKGNGDFMIVDISTNIFHPIPVEKPKEVIPQKIIIEMSLLQDSIDRYIWDIKKIQKRIDALNEELVLLKNSGVIKGQTKSDSIAALKDAMSYLRLMNSEINDLLFEQEFKIDKKRIQMAEMNSRLVALQNYKVKSTPPVNYAPIQQIIITVSAKKQVSGSIEVSYFLQQAGWTPSYDLRSKDTNSPMNLVYKANVFQYTGNNWDNVNVTLSTINPNKSNEKPVLMPWNLNYFTRVQTLREDTRAISLSNISLDTKNETESEKYRDYEEDDAVFDIPMKQTETMAMVEFEMDTKYTIPSDNLPHLLIVSTNEVKSDYQYYVVPKIDNQAYLLAKLTDWESLNLLPAVANVYYDGTFVGKTNLNPNIMTDTLSLALGTDRNVIVSRKKINDDMKEKTFTNDVVKTIEIEISVKNAKSYPIVVTIQDQIPVSINEDIKIDLLSKNGSELNKTKGLLTWNIPLKTNEKKLKTFKYSITYDKNQSLSLR